MAHHHHLISQTILVYFTFTVSLLHTDRLNNFSKLNTFRLFRQERDNVRASYRNYRREHSFTLKQANILHRQTGSKEWKSKRVSIYLYDGFLHFFFSIFFQQDTSHRTHHHRLSIFFWMFFTVCCNFTHINKTRPGQSSVHRDHTLENDLGFCRVERKRRRKVKEDTKHQKNTERSIIIVYILYKMCPHILW